MQKNCQKEKTIDHALLVNVLILLGFGLVALYSASTVESYKNFQNTTYYIKHQIFYGVGLGLLGLYICSKIDYHFWRKILPFLLLLSIILLGMVKLSPYGFSANGAERWLKFGFIFLQPAEFSKIVVVIYLSAWLEKNHSKINNFFFGLLPSILIIGLFSALIMWQPDLGTLLVLISVAFLLLFAAGIRWKHLFWMAVYLFLSIYSLIHFEPYRLKRITSFLNPQSDLQGIGYQINQALIGIGAGGLFGYGYGLSRQKHNYLPEVMSDSIFAVVAEELGFLRILFILLLFSFLAIKMVKISKAAPDKFGQLLAFGIASWLTVQVIINIAAIIKLLPLTGIPLPFFSYGSTAMMANLCAIGIILNISRHSQNRI